jgi:hypothetical protein
VPWFDGLDSSASRWWMLGLLAAWAILLFGGFVVGPTSADGSRRIPLWGRLGSSLVLVVAGWSWWWLARSTPVASVALLIALGMTLGFIGDVFMARVLPVAEPVIGGMSAFGLGHIAYIAGFLLLGRQSVFAATGPRWAAWLIWILLGAAGWYLVVWRGHKHSTLHQVALPYALLLASTAGVATGLALLSPALWILALGAALFLISDLILATQLFNHAHFPLISDVVWLTYGPAQALIVYTLALLL